MTVRSKHTTFVMALAVLIAFVLFLGVLGDGAPPSPPTVIWHPRNDAPTDLRQRLQRSGNGATLRPPEHSKSTFVAKLSPGGLHLKPAHFGGDPTGVKDSSFALQECVNQCVNVSKVLDPLGHFPGDTSFGNGKAIHNAGGCFIDLDGGEYKISKPIVFPEYVANIVLGFGSLAAADDFDGGQDSFLIVVGIQGSCKVPQGSCNIDINFPELFLDGRHKTSAMQINNVMGVTVGPGGYFLNFTLFGLQINAGHEVQMDRCWLGETNFDFDHEEEGRKPNATAIQINGNDHYILNTVVFSSKIGLEVNGAADYVTGVHVWFPDNHAVAFADTMAFHITGGGNRFSGCYIDGGRAVFEGGALSYNIWERGFECCQRGSAAPGTTSSGITLIGETIGPGLQIINNEFQGGSIFHVPESNAIVLDDEDSSYDVDNCNSSRFNISVADLDCQGLTEASASAAASLETCEAACCAQRGCSVYQWCGAGGSSRCDGASGNSAQCWLGNHVNSCRGTRKGWKGRAIGGKAPASSNYTITGTRISHNSMKGGVKGTQATKTLTQSQAKTWAFDFCDVLLFPQIAQVKVHIVAATGFPQAIARPPTGCHLVVETSQEVTGTILVEVDSSAPSSEFV